MFSPKDFGDKQIIVAKNDGSAIYQYSTTNGLGLTETPPEQGKSQPDRCDSIIGAFKFYKDANG